VKESHIHNEKETAWIPTTGIDDSEKKNAFLSCQKSNTDCSVVQPVAYSLYQLVYCEVETQFLNICYRKFTLNKFKQTELLPYR